MPRIKTCRMCQRPVAKHGLCVEHLRGHETQQRTDNLQWRSTKGQKVRRAYLAAHPYCFDCHTMFGRLSPATEVHHRKSQIDRPDLVFDWDNLVALCHACHQSRHHDGDRVVEKLADPAEDLRDSRLLYGHKIGSNP